MTDTIMDWVRGDLFGRDLPTNPAALQIGGLEFLTKAFRASGALAQDNSVTRIIRLDEWALGGTGVKAMLSVAYERDEANLPRELFMKFSRNFEDKVRDAGRHHMPPEVLLANSTLR